MFKFLEKLPAPELAGGVYYAVRTITHVKHVPNPAYDYLIENRSIPDVANTRTRDLIIQQIEQKEKLPLKQIPNFVLEKYVQVLARELQSALKQQWGYDERRGDELLRRFRQPSKSSVR